MGAAVGDVLRSLIGDRPALTAAQNAAIRRYTAGRDPRDRLVAGNLRLVRRAMAGRAIYGDPAQALSNALLVYVACVDTWDPQRGPLATFVIQSIQRALSPPRSGRSVSDALSLDAPAEDGTTISETIRDPSPGQEDLAVAAELTSDIADAIASLSAREALVISCRYFAAYRVLFSARTATG